MAERSRMSILKQGSRYDDMKMPELRQEVAKRELVDDEGLPLKSRLKAVLIDVLEKDDRKEGVTKEKMVKAAQQSSTRSPTQRRRGRPPKIRSRFERKELDIQLLSKAEMGDLGNVNKLIKKGADVNASNSQKLSPLMLAAWLGHQNVVKALIYNGANVNTTNRWGGTALMKAAEKGHQAIVKMLISERAKVNTATNDGWTALIYAAFWGHKEIVEMLIRAGADVNHSDRGGATALMFAALNGYKEIMEMLINAGADVNVTSHDRETARGLYRDKEEFDRIVEEFTPRERMVKAAR